jgi:2,4-dienoyl-CoA reductase-like NADH-dependent reductase (Old Yellow Enzyme family)
MAKLFEETSLNGMTLRNRIVRSATWEGMCEPDGRPTEKLILLYRDLAGGGVGLIISGYAFVRPEGKQLPGKMGIHTDEFSFSYENMTRAVHTSGSKISIQLVHAGGQADSGVAGQQPVAPSAVKVDQFPEKPAELTKDEIQEIVTAFGEGARRAKAWGFDAIQLHGAHGYLINQFLSPHTNQRDDEYGGNIENRCRFLLEVYQQVRNTVGSDYPVFIKLNANDNLEGGLETADAVYAARKLDQAGIDAIEVSSGTSASGSRNPGRIKINSPDKEAYNLDLAREIKAAVSCPVMLVGGLRSHEICEKVLTEDGMDYVALCRPLIREPGLPDRWKNGDLTRAECISCNGCFRPGLEEGGIYCVVKKRKVD